MQAWKERVTMWGSVPMGPRLVLWACVRAVPPGAQSPHLLRDAPGTWLPTPSSLRVHREAHSCGQREPPRQTAAA